MCRLCVLFELVIFEGGGEGWLWFFVERGGLDFFLVFIFIYSLEVYEKYCYILYIISNL